MSDVLNRLADEIRTEGGLLAGVVADPGDAAAPWGERAAAGRAGYALLVEAIHEGYLTHYGSPRVVVSEDPDLALLAGDRLYALGLARLADLGDLDGVAALAEVIAACARAAAEGDQAGATAAWERGATRIAGR